MTRRSETAMRLRMLRAKHSLSIGDVSAQTGLCRDTISELEKGMRDARHSTLTKLANVYGVPVATLRDGGPGQ